MLLVEIEGVFRTFTNGLRVCPFYHSLEQRVEAHLIVSFLAYCLWVTVKQKQPALAPACCPHASSLLRYSHGSRISALTYGPYKAE